MQFAVGKRAGSCFVAGGGDTRYPLQAGDTR